MACSKPLRLYKENIKPSKIINHSDFETSALYNSFGNDNYFEVPCRYCLNCRVDRQNEIVDRCEYEYINYGCGAFVTFTYDDVHLFKNSFINAKTGNIEASINKKDGKDFLNRLNKLVHKDNKKTGYNPLCRKDYKYLITHEMGDKFDRPHIHVLFFGLDFAYCERLFWRAWCNQGSIEVGAIKNGGIAYCVKYITDQQFGHEKFYKYTYNHLTPPSSSHSLRLGEGLYKGQLKYIREHDGHYRWHGIDRPVPTYYKNKYKIISDLDIKKHAKRYNEKKNKIYNLYDRRITSYRDFKEINLELAQRRQRNLEKSLEAHGKKVLRPEYIYKQVNDLVYKDGHRIPTAQDFNIVRIVDNRGKVLIKIGDELKTKITNRDLFKIGLDYNKLCRYYKRSQVDEMFGLEPIPF